MEGRMKLWHGILVLCLVVGLAILASESVDEWDAVKAVQSGELTIPQVVDGPDVPCTDSPFFIDAESFIDTWDFDYNEYRSEWHPVELRRIDTLWFARPEVPQPDIVQGDRAAVICTTRAVWQLRWR